MWSPFQRRMKEITKPLVDAKRIEIESLVQDKRERGEEVSDDVDDWPTRRVSEWRIIRHIVAAKFGGFGGFRFGGE